MPDYVESSIDGLCAGYLYLIWDGASFFKIGVASKNVKKRMAELQIGNPKKLYLVSSKLSGSVFEDEKHIHHCLKYYRMQGEWFELPVNVVSWLLNYLKSMNPNEIKLTSHARRFMKSSPTIPAGNTFLEKTEKVESNMSLPEYKKRCVFNWASEKDVYGQTQRLSNFFLDFKEWGRSTDTDISTIGKKVFSSILKDAGCIKSRDTITGQTMFHIPKSISYMA